jgi:hypothetical protein
MLNKVRQLTNLTFLEQALLLQLTALSFGIKVALTVLTLPQLTILLSRNSPSLWLRRIPLLHTRCSVDQLIRLIDLATTVSHGEGRCLPRALLLFWILHARQESAGLCLGVHTAMTTLYAHAWVELEGVVVGDSRVFTDRYTPILRFPA